MANWLKLIFFQLWKTVLLGTRAAVIAYGPMEDTEDRL